MQHKEWIAYVGLLAFPEGEAGSRRMLGVATALATAGEHITVLAGRGSYPVTALEGECGPGSISHAGVGEYDSNWSPLRKQYQILFGGGRKTVEWLDRQPSRPKAVILYGSIAPFLQRLRAWCSRSSVPLFADIVEWYSPGQLGHGGALNPMYWQAQRALRRLVGRCDGVIGISSLLCSYYRERGLRTVRIPPTLDVRNVAFRVDSAGRSGPIEIVYAGVPHRKDLLGNAIRGLAKADPQGKRFRLTVYGPTEETLDRLVPGYPRAAVVATGRKPHAVVMEAVRQADFTVLLRPDARYANAGFPTKVVESMSCGTPVICNLTSDLGDHIRHGEHGIVCADESPEAFVSALDEIGAMSIESRLRMRRAARRQAELGFDSRVYARDLHEFIVRGQAGAAFGRSDSAPEEGPWLRPNR